MDESDTNNPIRNLDWNLIRVFVTVVEEGSVTRGADRLLRTQPTVSSALKRLEESVGRRLIDRGSRRFELTVHGAVLYQEARAVSEAISQFGSKLHQADEDVTGSIRIAMPSYVVFPPFDEILAKFHAQYPSVKFTIDIMPSKQVVRTTTEGLSTFGICLLAKPQRRIMAEVLFREKFGFFCGANHPLFGRKDVSIADLKHSTYVALKTDRILDALHPIAKLRQKYGLGEEPTGISSSVEEIRRMISAGMGLGALPVHAMEGDVRDGRLWRIPLHDLEPSVDVHFIQNPRSGLDRGEEVFIERVMEYIRSTPLSERTYPLEECA